MSSFVRHCSRSWLPRGMCVNWNELQYLACATASRNRLHRGYQECGCPSIYSIIILQPSCFTLRLYQPQNTLCGKKAPEIMLTFSFHRGAGPQCTRAVDMACDVVAHMEVREPQLASALWGDRRGCFQVPSATTSPEVSYIHNITSMHFSPINKYCTLYSSIVCWISRFIFHNAKG